MDQQTSEKKTFKKKLRSAIQYLIVADVLLPIGMAFLFVFGRFFSFFGAAFSASILDIIALTLGFFWLLSLILLLFCTALSALATERTEDTE